MSLRGQGLWLHQPCSSQWALLWALCVTPCFGCAREGPEPLFPAETLEREGSHHAEPSRASSGSAQEGSHGCQPFLVGLDHGLSGKLSFLRALPK